MNENKFSKKSIKTLFWMGRAVWPVLFVLIISLTYTNQSDINSLARVSIIIAALSTLINCGESTELLIGTYRLYYYRKIYQIISVVLIFQILLYLNLFNSMRSLFCSIDVYILSLCINFAARLEKKGGITNILYASISLGVPWVSFYIVDYTLLHYWGEVHENIIKFNVPLSVILAVVFLYLLFTYRILVSTIIDSVNQNINNIITGVYINSNNVVSFSYFSRFSGILVLISSRFSRDHILDSSMNSKKHSINDIYYPYLICCLIVIFIGFIALMFFKSYRYSILVSILISIFFIIQNFNYAHFENYFKNWSNIPDVYYFLKIYFTTCELSVVFILFVVVSLCVSNKDIILIIFLISRILANFLRIILTSKKFVPKFIFKI